MQKHPKSLTVLPSAINTKQTSKRLIISKIKKHVWKITRVKMWRKWAVLPMLLKNLILQKRVRLWRESSRIKIFLSPITWWLTTISSLLAKLIQSISNNWEKIWQTHLNPSISGSGLSVQLFCFLPNFLFLQIKLLWEVLLRIKREKSRMFRKNVWCKRIM